MDEQTMRQIAVDIAMKLQGIPYIWGGSSPRGGFDCSGFACWVLQCVGVLPSGRWDAAELAAKFQQTKVPLRGDLAFYGSTPDAVSHVMMHIDDTAGMVTGASGGNHTTVSEEIAKQMGALVKVKPVKYRTDYLFSVNVAKPV